MLIACLDTSTEYASLTLFKDGEIILSFSKECRQGASKLLPFIHQQILAQKISINEINEWRVGKGPGSFTGMRVGISFVKGICFASQAKFYGVNSGYAYFDSSIKNGAIENIFILHDGRRQEVIVNHFQFLNNQWTEKGAEVKKISELEIPNSTSTQFISAMPKIHFPSPLAEKITFIEKIDTKSFINISLSNSLNNNEMDESCEPIYVRPPVFVNPS